jgi:chromate transport protein ChrA
MTVLAALAFIGTFFFNLSFAIVVIGAVVLGLSAGLLEIGAMINRVESAQPFRDVSVTQPLDEKDLLDHTRPSAVRLLWTLVLWLALWFVPLITLIVTLGWEDIYSRIAILLSEMAALSIGGPYAVNTYVATQAVANGWLTYGEALDGLALAELVPGPVIQFLQFVGFTAAYRHPGIVIPFAGAALAGLLTVWFTFIPTFLWIFLIAPFIEVFRNNKIINAMLSAVTGGLLGVLLTFALRFGNRTLFADLVPVNLYGLDLTVPRLASVDPWALAITIAAAIATFRFKLGIVPTLAGACAVGLIPHVLAAPETGSLYSGLLGFAAGAAIGFPVGPVAVWCLHLRAEQRRSMVAAIIAGSVIGDVVVAAGFFLVIDALGGVFASLQILHRPVVQGPFLILSGIALLYVVNRSAVLGLPRQNEGREQKWIYVGTSVAFLIGLAASVTHPENLLAIGSVFAILGIGSDSGLIVLAGFFLGTLTMWFSAIELLYRLGESQGRRIMRHVMQALCVMCMVAGLVQLGRGLGLL